MAHNGGESADQILEKALHTAGRFVLVSWNINGIDSDEDPEDFVQRMCAIGEVLVEAGAAVVLLQEVVEPALAVFRKLLGPVYHLLVPPKPKAQYFCAMLLLKGKVKPVGNLEVEDFPGSKMGRHLLKQRVRVDEAFTGSFELLLLTAHLESTLPCAVERRRQLERALGTMAAASADGRAAVFGGDLNLRDNELTGVKLLKGMVDAWKLCGSAASERWTWVPAARGKNRGSSTRFDRILLCPAAPGCADVVEGEPAAKRRKVAGKEAPAWRFSSFRLLGREIIQGLGQYPSDHWAVSTELQFSLAPGLKAKVSKAKAKEKVKAKAKAAASSPSSASSSSSSSSSSKSSNSSNSSSLHGADAEDGGASAERASSRTTTVAVSEEAGGGQTAADDGIDPARKAAGALLQKALTAAGASAEEAAAWGPAVEAAAWAAVESAAMKDDEDYHGFLATIRRYRSEVRRIAAALRDARAASGLLVQLRSGELDAAQLAALPPEQLLPAAKLARLQSLRAGTPEESGRKELPFKDDDRPCAECGKTGVVRWAPMPGVREGCGKPESWGASENDGRGEMRRACCDVCLAEWTFEE